MNIATNAEIHFHQQEQVSIYFESNASDDDEKMGEIGLLTFFALRMMNSLGVNETSDNLGSVLTHSAELVSQLASGPTTRGVELIPHPGYQGRKRFLVDLRMTDTHMLFDMKAKGFGFFAVRVGYYGPIAVLAFLRFLVEKRSDDLDYLDALVRAATMCGQFQLQRQISLINQPQLGYRATMFACEKYMPDEDGHVLRSVDRPNDRSISCYSSSEDGGSRLFQEQFKKAEQGHADSQYNLGLTYYNGEGIPKDDAEAVKR